MTEENSLVPLDALQGESSIVKSDDVFKEMTKSGDYLSRLQLMSSNSEVCKKGEFPVNHFAIVRDQENIDVGNSVDVLVISWRAKALDMSDDNLIDDFDPKSETFQAIQQKSFVKDSRCMYGPEYLVYLPTTKEYLTLFFGTKSARREAGKVQSLLGKAATLKPKFIETKQHSWHVITATPCSTPFEVPPIEDIKKVVHSFENPPKRDVEIAPEEESGGERAR